MGKFIVISDTHFHNWKEFSKPDEVYVNSRLKEQVEVLEEVFKTAEDKEATILFAGDMFHKRQAVDTRVFNTIYEVFEKYSHVPVYGIPGNHDKVSNSLKSESSIDIFNYIDNTTVKTEMDKVEVDGVGITFVPYGDEVEEIKEYLKKVEVEEDKVNILVAHLGVSGSIVGKGGHRLEGAFTYNDLQPEKFDYILLGHYHKPQILNGNDNHIYVGTLTQNNFGEEGNVTGAVYVDTNKKELSRIPFESTKFITIEGDNIPENVEKLMEESYVRFTGSRAQAKALENMVEDLTNVRVSVEEKAQVETRIDIDSTTDPVKITEKYMQEYHPKSVDKALECIKEAMANVKV